MLTCALLAGSACAQDQQGLEGEISLHASFSESTYTSKQFALDGSFLAKVPDGEAEGHIEVDREYVRAPGQSSSVSTDKIDSNIKRKFFLTAPDYYAYLSPRFRHDRYGYYENSLALRVARADDSPLIPQCF